MVANESDWEKVVKKGQEVCAACEAALVFGADVVTALTFADGGFARRDLHPDCHSSDDDAIATWRWKRETELRPNARRLDLGFLSEFFKRLDGREDGQSRRVAWIVSLLLLRKKILKEVGRKATDDREVLELRFKKTERVYEVPDPLLDVEAMESIESDLSRIFNLEQAAPASAEGDAQESA